MKRILLTPTTQEAALAEAALAEAAKALQAGGLVVYPTETMYGAGVTPHNPAAVSKLLAFKNRPAGKAISLLVEDEAMAATLVTLNAQAKTLYSTFLPGPVTIISQAVDTVDTRLVSELGTLGIRISSHPVAAALVALAGPLTATSANASGKARPYSIETMLKGLSPTQLAQIDLILDAGELPHNEPSTVIDTTTQVQEVVRAGSLFVDAQEPVITYSPAETAAYAAKLMNSLTHALAEKPVVLALEGEMGAGKTHFVQGLAKSLGITQPVSSPTYVIQKEYHTELARLVHMDCWRLQEVSPELLELDQYIVPGTVLAVEWAAPLLPYLRSKDDLVGYQILIEHLDETTRRIRVQPL